MGDQHQDPAPRGQSQKPAHPDEGVQRSKVKSPVWTKTAIGIFSSIAGGTIGALVAGTFAILQQQSTQNTAQLREKEQQASMLTSEFAAALVHRAVLTDLVREALLQPVPNQDLTALWAKYLEAYDHDRLEYFRNHLNVEGHFEDDANLNESNAGTLWFYEDLVIEPRFEDMHQCLSRAYRAYRISSVNPAEASFAATRVLQGCEGNKWWDHYEKRDRDGDHSVRTWAAFETCLETFTYQIDLSVRIQRQIWEGTPWRVSLRRAMGRLVGRKECGAGTRCSQKTFFASLPDAISQDCGIYPKPGYD